MIAGLVQTWTLSQCAKNQPHQGSLKTLFDDNIDNWRDNFLYDLTHASNYKTSNNKNNKAAI